MPHHIPNGIIISPRKKMVGCSVSPSMAKRINPMAMTIHPINSIQPNVSMKRFILFRTTSLFFPHGINQLVLEGYPLISYNHVNHGIPPPVSDIHMS